MHRLAVVDIGSNTSTLAVYEASPEGGLDRISQIGEPLRLMRRLGPDRRFPETAIARTVEVVRGFAAHAASLGVTGVEAVATSAVRDALNQDELLRRLREILPVRVLDGETEGVCAASSAVNMLPLTDGFVVDQGGGSLQISHITTRRSRQVVSLPLGALRLTDRFLANEPLRADAITAMRRYVQSQLATQPWFQAGAGGDLVAIGGSIRALAKLTRRALGWPLRAGHGYRLSLDAVESAWEMLSRMTPEQRKAIPGLAAHRVDTAAASAFTWFLLMRAAGFDEVRVSSYGLREGVAIRRLLGSDGDGLLPDVRLAGLSSRFPGPGASAVTRVRALAAEHDVLRWRPALTLATWVRASGHEADVGRLYEAPLAGFWQEEVLAGLDLLGDHTPRALPVVQRTRLRALVAQALGAAAPG